MMSMDSPEKMDTYVHELAAGFEYEGEIPIFMLPGMAYRFRDYEQDFKDFIRRCILRLLQVGAVPVRGAESGPYRWATEDFDGKSPDEVADMAMSELEHAEDMAWVNIWFVKAYQVGR